MWCRYRSRADLRRGVTELRMDRTWAGWYSSVHRRDSSRADQVVLDEELLYSNLEQVAFAICRLRLCSNQYISICRLTWSDRFRFKPRCNKYPDFPPISSTQHCFCRFQNPFSAAHLQSTMLIPRSVDVSILSDSSLSPRDTMDGRHGKADPSLTCAPMPARVISCAMQLEWIN